MKHIFAVLWLLGFCISALAQDDLPNGALPTGAAPAGRSLQILEVGDDDVSTLRGVGGARRADAISLGTSLSALRSDNAAWQALAGWVRDGGVVFLHTDAAQLFGYRTVQAREGTPQLAGQLYGRARNALPFGAHPLLWTGLGQSTALPSLAPSSLLLPELGVQIVYYQFDPGDALVVDHPAAVPLLRVTDLAIAEETPLYAAAIAPFGKGWAVFAPRLVEQNRANGAPFAQNLIRLVRSVGPSPFDAPPLGATAPATAPSTSNVSPLVGIPAPLVDQLSDNASAGHWSALLAAWQKAMQVVPAAFMQPADITKADNTPRLMVDKSEADAVGAGLASAAQGGNSTNLRALISLLRARLEYQRLDAEKTEQWLAAAEQLAPDTAEVLLLRGIVTAGTSQNLLLSSQQRGEGFNSAAQDWTEALTATPLVRAATGARSTYLGGIPTEGIRNWIASSTRASGLMSVEPPLVTDLESANGDLVVRHFRNDPTLRLALPAAALLARADTLLGWHMDEEEILIFPSDEYYVAYTTAARTGMQEVAFNPLSRRANVLGNRIQMVSAITLQVLIDPGPPPRYAQLGTGIPAVLGRLHAQVLMNALTQDGTPPPAWMQLGLMSLANLVIVSDLRNEPTPNTLRDVAAVGGLLTPRQFENVNLANDRAGVVEAQARRLMTYFYNRFGSGALVETLQRLGAGETVDEALIATTQMDEAQLFLSWRDAEFGRRVP